MCRDFLDFRVLLVFLYLREFLVLGLIDCCELGATQDLVFWGLFSEFRLGYVLIAQDFGHFAFWVANLCFT